MELFTKELRLRLDRRSLMMYIFSVFEVALARAPDTEKMVCH